MKKRVLSLLLVLCLTFCLIPAALADAPDFTLEANGQVITAMEESVLSTFVQDGWTTYDDVRLITVTLPAGTDKVTFTSFSAGSVLAYNYTPDGNYIAGYYEDFQIGAPTAQCPVDADGDGTADYIAVQTPYDSEFNSDLLYLVTFKYDSLFTLEANGQAVTAMEESVLPTFVQDGWTTYDDVRLITVTLPAGTDEVTFTSFSAGSVLAYNYTPDGNYIAGYYEDFQTGAPTAQCPVDADGDGAADYIAVQTPYDSEFNSDLLYLVTFKYAGFTDVSADDWFFSDVTAAVSAGLIDCTAPGTFAPNAPMTRAIFVIALYRLAGTPSADSRNPFADVTEEDASYDAVVWAYSEGIIDGRTDTQFDPEATVTRQEAAAMLYRYCGTAGDHTALNAYTDKGQIAGWATDAMGWAVNSGILNGRTAETLAPRGTVTRAEAAAMLLRLSGK